MVPEQTFWTVSVILTAVQFVLMILCSIRLGQCKVVVQEVIKTIEEMGTVEDTDTVQHREIGASLKRLQPALDRIGLEVKQLHARLDVVENNRKTAASAHSLIRADRTLYRRRR